MFQWVIFILAIVIVIGIILSHHMMKQKLFVLQDFDARMIKKSINRVIGARALDRSELLLNLVETSKAEQTLLDLIERRNSSQAEDFSGIDINESLQIASQQKQKILSHLLNYYPELKSKHELASKIGFNDSSSDEETDYDD